MERVDVWVGCAWLPLGAGGGQTRVGLETSSHHEVASAATQRRRAAAPGISMGARRCSFDEEKQRCLRSKSSREAASHVFFNICGTSTL